MRCNICEIGCEIKEGKFGACKMYLNKNGKIVERFPNMYLAIFPVSIETMPILHFYPKGKFLQVGTVGCNFKCNGCISKILVDQANSVSGILKRMRSEDIVKEAIAENCIGISFFINEPTVSYYTFKDLAKRAKDNGLFVGCSTNAYFTEKALRELIPHIDFVNIGIKGYSDDRYRSCGAKSSKFVFRNLKLLYDSNVHVEVATVYIKGSEDEVIKTARYVSSISKDIPFQVMRFIPFGDASIDLEPTIRESEVLCDELRDYLNYVYLFNSPGTKYLNTICSNCGKTVFEREFYGPMGSRVIKNRSEGLCECGYKIPFEGVISGEQFDEKGFFGGYRYTRALEMIHAILVAVDADDKDIGKIWSDVIRSDYFKEFHEKIQKIDSYLNIIRYFAKLSNREEKGEELIGYIERKVDFIASRSKGADEPRVYYSMGYPLFALNKERFENDLVETAGGKSVNKLIKRKGKPGINISRDEFNDLNPEVVFISGFLSSPVSDFYDYCLKNDLVVDAIKDKNVYRIYPGWDFGSPRWILGLMCIANKIHPEIFNFDMEEEADKFYWRFYRLKFSSIEPNRSFHRASAR
ncbi:MAG: Radical SAM superfamily protein [Candidatus Methanolliviera sp. GoM_asphalt]|nr:MAG: Radical SAM superfamily protein [Candidatus Methanolliviera sp. GoM_asphalt]